MANRILFLLLAVTLVMRGAETVHVSAHRLSPNPLLRPGGRAWDDFALFNPTAIKVGNKTVLLFRAQDKNHTSRIGYAESADGLHFTVRPEPVLSPETEYEKGGGLEDPRVVQINGTYFLTYTGYNLRDAQLCLATSNDLIHWERHGIILPAYRGTWNTKWTKSGAILPEKVNDKWWMYYLGTRTDSDGKDRDYMGLASSNDLFHWADATDRPVLDGRPGAFDSRVMEPGPAPFLTDAGILLFYNGANDQLVYGPGWVLFDRNDPRHLLARAETPFLLPTLIWEKMGNVPNVIFFEGAVLNSMSAGSLHVTGYYGGADKYVGAMQIEAAFGAPPSSDADNHAVRDVIAEYMRARNEKNPQATRRLFTPDADQLVSTGEWRRGLNDLTRGMTASSQKEVGKSSIEVESVRFIEPDVAIADGRYQTTSVGGAVRNMWTTIILKRTGGEWRITAIRNMLPTPPAAAQ